MGSSHSPPKPTGPWIQQNSHTGRSDTTVQTIDLQLLAATNNLLGRGVLLLLLLF